MDATLRTSANEALHTIVRTAPHLRNAVLMSVAVHISALPEDNMAVRGGGSRIHAWACMVVVVRHGGPLVKPQGGPWLYANRAAVYRKQDSEVSGQLALTSSTARQRVWATKASTTNGMHGGWASVPSVA